MIDSDGSGPPSEAGTLMTTLLESLLADFDHWFSRGGELLSRCPDSVMSAAERQQLAERLEDGRRRLVATRALMTATDQPVAVSLDAMTSWHGLVTEGWRLSARIRRRGDVSGP